MAADERISEKELSQHVVNLAKMLGWKVARWPTWRPTGTDAGVPDLIMVREGQVLFVELKAEKGKLTPAQEDWAYQIDGAYHGSADAYPWRPWYYVWRPADWFGGKIDAVLA